MKLDALRFLVCPVCHGDLDLHREVEDVEVLTGTLDCRGCRRAYPVVGGVPRFVDEGAYATSFADQWHWFRKVQLDSFNGTGESEAMLKATTGLSADEYRGRLVLDAGVGAGRFAEIVAKHGGEVVGVDLTRAVDAAYANIGRNPRVHLIQADIFAMPFRRQTFDVAYSIGVLHHTPDPRAAFERVAAVAKKGAALAVYVYSGYGIAYRGADVIRCLTTRLPRRLMLALTTVAIPLYYLYRLPGLGAILRLLAPISMHRHWRVRWLDTFDWYTPRYQWKLLYPEVVRWFRDNGFSDIELFEDPIRLRGTKTA
jgi:SAM-dependent methyltransferase